jgi:hypothetical protein
MFDNSFTVKHGYDSSEPSDNEDYDMLGSNVIVYVNGENEVIPFILKHEDASTFTNAFFQD